MEGEYRMNKLTIGLIIVLVLVGGFLYMNLDDSEDVEVGGSNDGQMVDEPVSSYSNLDSSENVFSEIDSSLEFIDS